MSLVPTGLMYAPQFTQVSSALIRSSGIGVNDAATESCWGTNALTDWLRR